MRDFLDTFFENLVDFIGHTYGLWLVGSVGLWIFAAVRFFN